MCKTRNQLDAKVMQGMGELVDQAVQLPKGQPRVVTDDGQMVGTIGRMSR